MINLKNLTGVALTCALLTACQFQRAETARTAQTQLIGQPKEAILACMGAPANRSVEGATEVWLYPSGNGQTNGVAVASGSGGFGSVFGITRQRFCTVNVVMTNGLVSKVNYSGPTGGVLTAGEQCAYAVENCVSH